MIKSYVNTFIDYLFPKEMQILMHFAALIKVAREFDKKKLWVMLCYATRFLRASGLSIITNWENTTHC